MCGDAEVCASGQALRPCALPAVDEIPFTQIPLREQVIAARSGLPLSAVWRSARRAVVERPAALGRGGGRALEPVYGFRSLLAFKAKFQPEYRPLHLCYPDPAALPAIGLTIARAYLPDLTARQSARLLTHLRG